MKRVSYNKYILATALLAFASLLVFLVFQHRKLVVHFVNLHTSVDSDLKVITWNIAAINNNPFEYWLSFDGNKYDDLMNAVQLFVKDEKYDIVVDDVFTEEMCEYLLLSMREAFDDDDDAIDAVADLYEKDYSKRKIVSEFLRDDIIGKKRLASMPDRVTNTIPLKKDGAFVYRPTVINCFNESFHDVQDWFDKWRHFMFHNPIDTTTFGIATPATV